MTRGSVSSSNRPTWPPWSTGARGPPRASPELFVEHGRRDVVDAMAQVREFLRQLLRRHALFGHPDILCLAYNGPDAVTSGGCRRRESAMFRQSALGGALIGLLAMSALAAGQTQTPRAVPMGGTVRDLNGQPVPGASVILQRRATTATGGSSLQLVAEARTDEHGAFSLGVVPLENGDAVSVGNDRASRLRSIARWHEHDRRRRDVQRASSGKPARVHRRAHSSAVALLAHLRPARRPACELTLVRGGPSPGSSTRQR